VGVLIAEKFVLVLQTRHFHFIMLIEIFVHIPAETETTGLLRELQTPCSLLKTHVS
jgi:hypothetical protein